MSLYRETKKKVIGGVVARSIGYRWPSPPFFDGGSLPFLLFSLRVLHTLSQTLSGCLTHFTVHECECYQNGYFQAINFFWNYCGTELQLPRNIAPAVSRCFCGFKLWYWNALNDLKVSWNLSQLWKNISIPFEWRPERLALVLTALALELKKEDIDDTVCRCIVFYPGGEKKARQVFSAKKCKLDFSKGLLLVCTWRRLCWWSKTKTLLSSGK